MEIKVNQLGIDLTISEINVLQKITSLKENGLVQPVTIWEKGYRIIDGFHRVEAARRLGWDTIECHLVSCSEEAFWDARIQSAQQHHDISGDRLKQWILECWQSSKFCQEGDKKEVAAALWKVKKEEHYENELARWLTSRAEKWQVTFDFLVEIFLVDYIHLTRTFKAPDYRDTVNDLLDSKAETFEDRLELEEKIPLNDSRFSGKYIRAYPKELVEKYLETNPDQSLPKFVDEYLAKEKKRDQPKPVLESNIRDIFLSIGRKVKYHGKRNRETLKEMEDGPELLFQICEATWEMVREIWPNIDQVPEQYGILSELTKLRRELGKEHDLRVRAEAELLEKQERHKKLKEKLGGVIAWPGE